MSSSFNTISLSPARPFLLAGAGGGLNNFNRQVTAMTMIQRPNPVARPLPNPVAPPPRRRRNQPGNPHPDAEVIALSPEEITATNRFLCEVCNKGFQREQNLQLHRRGHNLPWKLKQKSNEEVRRKVYICPVIDCVHHDPARALGDLTGIKKHYLRKHGEKKWRCVKCTKCYAVQSDWKAHSKICGTKEYRCDCGTLFSRRDSYITHRSFCDALIRVEAERKPTVNFTAGGGGGGRYGFYGRLDGGALSHSHFGNNANSGLTPLAAAYNRNRSSPVKFEDFLAQPKFEDFLAQPTNPNPSPTNFFMNQGLMNDQSLMNQQGLTNLGDNIINNNNWFNLGYFEDDTKNTDLFTNGADNNDPCALLRGFTSPSPTSVVVNDFGENDTGNYQGLMMNSLAATTDHQGQSNNSLFDLHFGNNLSMGAAGSDDRLTLDFLGVNGGMMNNVNGRAGRNGGAPNLDAGVKYSHPHHPFGKA